MSETNRNNETYEPNFILRDSSGAPAEDAVRPAAESPAAAEHNAQSAAERSASPAAEQPAAAEHSAQSAAERSASPATEHPAATAQPNFILRDSSDAPAEDAVRPAAEQPAAAEHSAQSAAERSASPAAEHPAATAQPNFILRDSSDAPAEDAVRPAAESPAAAEHSAQSAAERSASPAADAASGTSGKASPTPRESASEILRAAAARADALKAAATKADQTVDPHRMQTSSIDGVEERLHPTEGVSDAGQAPGFSGAASGNASGGAFTGATQGSAQNKSHPKYENPSFDPGRTGHYTDPRMNFRSGPSASWSNGEFQRSRRQMKDSIRRQQKPKKGAQPVTLTRRAFAFLIAGCMCLSCLFGLGGAALGTSLVQQNQAPTAQTTATSAKTSDTNDTAASAGYTLESATGSNMTIKEITHATQNSVVEIRTESVASDTWMQQYVTQGAGSGVIISDDGYIMTNNHVIEGANKIKVTTADEKEYEATLIGTDDSNDVAVLKIDAKDLTPAVYGNSDNLEVGDMAVAIGNPLGELGGTVTAGIISATDRELAIDGKTLHLLQTDSSINPGNSGGGLFNGDGQLIGLVVAKSSGSDVEGLGFAIPVNTAANVAQQLIDKGYVSGQPSTGMTYQEGSPGGSNQLSPFDSFFGSSASTGVYIYSVNGENAKKAGFESGDQVYAVDGEEIGSFDDLSAIISSHKVGDKVKFTIIRDGVQKNIKLELEEKTPNQDNTGSSDQGQNNGQGQGNGQDQNGQNGQQPGDENGQMPGDQGDLNDFGGWQDFFNDFF